METTAQRVLSLAPSPWLLWEPGSGASAPRRWGTWGLLSSEGKVAHSAQGRHPEIRSSLRVWVEGQG